MKKWAVEPEIYRLPPSRNFPKGVRVRKAVFDPSEHPSVCGTPIVRVSDGKMAYTKCPLKPEEGKL